MIQFNTPVSLCFMTLFSQWTSLTVLCPVNGYFRFISRIGGLEGSPGRVVRRAGVPAVNVVQVAIN